MQKKFINTLVLLVTMCFLTLFFSGCKANKSPIQTASPMETATPTQATAPSEEIKTPASTATPAETPTPSAELQTPDSITSAPTATPTETPSPSLVSQTPGSTSANQINSSESVNVKALETGLEDGTEVKLFVSGQELVKLYAVIMDGEILVPDFTSVFGKLKNASGNESAGFWSLSFVDKKSNIETVVIENSQYSIKIVEGEKSFICNDEVIPLTVPAQRINGHIMVPLNSIADAINATVEWDEAAQAISFFY